MFLAIYLDILYTKSIIIKRTTIGVIDLFSHIDIKGNMNLIILSVLSKNDKYGYEISKEIYTLTEQRIRLKEGSLYPALHRLEKQALIEGYWVEQEPGKPNRKYYRITEKGRSMIELEKQEWISFIKIMGRIICEGESTGI